MGIGLWRQRHDSSHDKGTGSVFAIRTAELGSKDEQKETGAAIACGHLCLREEDSARLRFGKVHHFNALAA